MKKADVTSKRNSLRTAAWVILTIIVVSAVGSIIAIRNDKKMELIEDGFYVQGNYVNLDGFLRSKGFFPRRMGAVDSATTTIRYKKNDSTEVCIVDSVATTTVRGTNIPEATFAKNGDLRECHLCWIFSRDDPNDPGAADLKLPVEVVVKIFDSEGGQRK